MTKAFSKTSVSMSTKTLQKVRVHSCVFTAFLTVYSSPSKGLPKKGFLVVSCISILRGAALRRRAMLEIGYGVRTMAINLRFQPRSQRT